MHPWYTQGNDSPPTWIVKLILGQPTNELNIPFEIKPIPSKNSKPLLVFINLKSGEHQGYELMQKFQWLLNPRQVFYIKDGDVIHLDRWNLKVEPNKEHQDQLEEEGARERLPLNVFNNHFLIGVNTLIKNGKFEDSCNYITLECDGVDLTARLKKLRVNCVLFFNIPSNGGGGSRVSNARSYSKPQTDDGIIEVIGALQDGVRCTCITQCRSARIITSRTLPMQVDGERCRLLPSIITFAVEKSGETHCKSQKS